MVAVRDRLLFRTGEHGTKAGSQAGRCLGCVKTMSRSDGLICDVVCT